MARLRWVAITLAPPLVYVMVLYLATRPPKPVYTFARHTVMTVTDRGGPAILHAPPAIYPPQALRAKLEGSVILNVTIAADGTVARAGPISGPEPLRRWQFEAKAQETQIDVGFSPRHATHSLALPEPERRTAPVYQGGLHGSVRVVAMVDPQGRVESVRPVTGSEKLVPAAVESVRQWTFRPMLRDGKPEYGTAVVDVPFGL